MSYNDSVKKHDFEKFYQTHLDKVYRFVFFRVSANKELAEDLVSEIFMKALEHFETYDPKISQSAWIMTICKNHMANYYRDKKPVGSLPEETDENVDSFWLNLASRAFKKESIKKEIYELLAKLDENTREIVTFHYIFGYSYLEIAEMKGMTETAVKVAAHRAIKKLSKFAQNE